MHKWSGHTCPWKPTPEPSSVVSINPIDAARIPSNACTETGCACFLTQVDPKTGKVVAGACFAVVAAASLGGMQNILGSIVVQHTAKPAETN